MYCPHCLKYHKRSEKLVLLDRTYQITSYFSQVLNVELYGCPVCENFFAHVVETRVIKEWI